MKQQSQLPAERFIVVAVLPQDRAGTFQYRIRPTGAGPQRMATELESPGKGVIALSRTRLFPPVIVKYPLLGISAGLA